MYVPNNNVSHENIKKKIDITTILKKKKQVAAVYISLQDQINDEISDSANDKNELSTHIDLESQQKSEIIEKPIEKIRKFLTQHTQNLSLQEIQMDQEKLGKYIEDQKQLQQNSGFNLKQYFGSDKIDQQLQSEDIFRKSYRPRRSNRYNLISTASPKKKINLHQKYMELSQQQQQTITHQSKADQIPTRSKTQQKNIQQSSIYYFSANQTNTPKKKVIDLNKDGNNQKDKMNSSSNSIKTFKDVTKIQVSKSQSVVNNGSCKISRKNSNEKNTEFRKMQQKIEKNFHFGNQSANSNKSIFFSQFNQDNLNKGQKMIGINQFLDERESFQPIDCITSGRGDRSTKQNQQKPKFTKDKKMKSHIYGTGYDDSKYIGSTGTKFFNNKSTDKTSNFQENPKSMQRQHSAKLESKYIKIFKELENLNKKFNKV